MARSTSGRRESVPFRTTGRGDSPIHAEDVLADNIGS